MKIWFASLLGISGALNSEAVQHLTHAQALQLNVLPEDNSYRHKDIEVTWKSENGQRKYTCHADCSGLISALLEHSYGYTKQELKDWIGGKRRPLSKHFYDTIVAEKGFKRILQTSNIQPGDFIAIKFPPGGEDSGHIMIVASAPEMRTASPPIIDNTIQWAISIIDSTTHVHGTTDSRYKAPKTFQTGIGEGTIRIYTDSSDIPVGYTWSTLHLSEFKDSTERPLVVGRLKPNYKP